MRPAPWQVSQRPPDVLKENREAVKPLEKQVEENTALTKATQAVNIQALREANHVNMKFLALAGRPMLEGFPPLEREVEGLRARLRSTVEQYEASGEELKASNEELQAMNEELRSASEELETSREELQSHERF